MPSDTEALYPPRLRAWCEASAIYYRLLTGTGSRAAIMAAEAKRWYLQRALRGMEVLAAEWIERQSSDADGLSGEADSYDYYVTILTPPAEEDDHD